MTDAKDVLRLLDLISRVQVRADGECWEWMGTVDAAGYAVAGSARVHRLIASVDHDLGGLVVRHLCDNRRCVNPAHLVPGTHADNVADRVAHGRSALGERHGRARLTEPDVLRIWELFRAGCTTHKLAREFGVNSKTVWQIVNRKTWRHVTEGRL